MAFWHRKSSGVALAVRPLTDALPLDELATKGKAVVRHEGRQILPLHTERGVRRGDEQDPRDERGQVSMVPG
jgi:hypothetical protein